MHFISVSPNVGAGVPAVLHPFAQVGRMVFMEGDLLLELDPEPSLESHEFGLIVFQPMDEEIPIGARILLPLSKIVMGLKPNEPLPEVTSPRWVSGRVLFRPMSSGNASPLAKPLLEPVPPIG